MTEKKPRSSLVSHHQARPLSQSQRLLNNKRAAAKVKLRPSRLAVIGFARGAKMRPPLRTLLDANSVAHKKLYMHSDTPPVNSTYF